MTAELTYQIIQSLSQKERDKLFEMLEPEMKQFDLDELLTEEVNTKLSNDDIMMLLIKNCFSKVKKT